MAFPLTGRIELVWLFIVETTYLYYLVLRLRKGLPRFLALLFLIPLALLVTWRAPTAIERTVYCSFFMWFLMFKFLLLAWDKGLAADSYALSTFPRFVYACQSCVPLELDPRFSNQKRKAAENRSLDKEADTQKLTSKSEIRSLYVEPQESPAKCFSWMQKAATSQALSIVILRCVVYFSVTVSLLRIVLIWKDVLPESVLDLGIGFFMYFWCLLFLEVGVMIPASIVGTELEPMFNMPILADSLGDFWGRRWNLLVVNLLRVSVYEPILVFLTQGNKPVPADRAISTMATFLVSGLMHELAIFYASRSRPSWEITTFFVLNGAGTILERFLKAHCKFRVPRLLKRASTLSFVYFTAYLFLIPPLIQRALLDGMTDLRASLDGKNP